MKRGPDGLHGRSRLDRLYGPQYPPRFVGEVAHLVEERVRLGNLFGLVRLHELPGQVLLVTPECGVRRFEMRRYATKRLPADQGLVDRLVLRVPADGALRGIITARRGCRSC